MQPFEWSQNVNGQMAAKALDISAGVNVILQMIEKDLLAMETDDETYFSVAQRAGLLRMAITSSKLLANEAEHELMRINSASF